MNNEEYLEYDRKQKTLDNIVVKENSLGAKVYLNRGKGNLNYILDENIDFFIETGEKKERFLFILDLISSIQMDIIGKLQLSSLAECRIPELSRGVLRLPGDAISLLEREDIFNNELPLWEDLFRWNGIYLRHELSPKDFIYSASSDKKVQFIPCYNYFTTLWTNRRDIENVDSPLLN